MWLREQTGQIIIAVNELWSSSQVPSLENID